MGLFDHEWRWPERSLVGHFHLATKLDLERAMHRQTRCLIGVLLLQSVVVIAVHQLLS